MLVQISGSNSAVPFLTAYDRQGYEEYEVFDGDDIVDQDYESIGSIIARMQRGEVIQKRDAYYESDNAPDSLVLLDNMDTLESPDADLSDVSLLLAMQAQGKKEADASTAAGEAAVTPPVAEEKKESSAVTE